MAKNTIADLDTTAGNNTDILGQSTQGTAAVSTIDTMIQNALGMLARFYADLGGTGTVGGTADAITLTTASTYQALEAGLFVGFKAGGTNTGATTINVDALGAKAIRRRGDSALQAGDILDDGVYLLRYDTAYNAAAGAWVLLNPEAAVSFATNAQAVTGTSTVLSVNPANLGALLNAGSDNTGGATITMGDGGYFNLITSTTAITAFAFTNDAAGRTARVRFDTARTLTHNATSLILPGGANITTAQGDIAQIRSLGSGNFVVEWYTPATSSAAVITAWVDYTPTYQGFGTPTSVKASSRRVGGNLEVRIKFTTGTVSADEARVTFGFNGTSANVTSNGTVISAIQSAAVAAVGYAFAGGLHVLIEGGVSYFTFARQTATEAGLTKANGNIVINSTTPLSFNASIPITGWS